MYLSRLEIFGFKSFAQKVELKFNGGITAIVGPNGAGKTNIVDAIRWVLGEQKASILRSDKMEDVIFNGTKNRKPLGMAEVSITIENTKGILPMEYSEVTITRRIFRSGESEYFLNKTPCRLKDIIDLFADTGMGANAYSVIELKMVESLLSDKAEERRKLFEEAAGITKYKQRKKTTYRKLEDVQNDLSRVNDIIQEVQKNVASLERQAKKAEKYNQIMEELKKSEIELFEREYSELHKTLIFLQETLNRERDRKNTAGNELSRGEQLLEVLKSELITLESQLDKIRSLIETRTSELNQTEQEILLLKERRKSLSEKITTISNQKIELQHHITRLAEKIESKKILLEEITTRIELLKGEYEKNKNELDLITRSLEQKRQQVKELNENLIAKINTIAQKRNELEKIKARIENLRGRISILESEDENYKVEIENCDSEIVSLVERKTHLLHELNAVERIISEKESFGEQLKIEIDGLQKKSFVIQSEIGRKISKIDFLRELMEKHADLSEGAQFLIRHFNSNFKSVSDVIDVEPEFANAIESALGEASGYLIVDTVAEAENAIEVLKLENKNKVTFICLEKIPEKYATNLPANGNGVIGWANEIVSCEKKFKKVVDFLLDDYLIVRDKKSALEALEIYGAIKCVTLDGEVFTDEGLLKGGSTNGATHSIIGKRKQIEILESEVKKLKGELDDIQRQINEKNAKIEKLNLNIKELSEKAKEVQAKISETEKLISQAEYRRSRASISLENNEREKAKLLNELSELERVSAEFERELKFFESQREATEFELSSATAEFEKLDREWAQKADDVNELHIKLVSAENERENIKLEIARLEDELSQTLRKINLADSEIEDTKLIVENSNQKIYELSEKLDAIKKEVELLRERLKEVQSQHSEKLIEIQTLERKIKEERTKYEEYISTLHDIEMKISEVRMEMRTIKERAKEEYGIEIEYREFADSEENNIASLKETVENLKQKIKSLGPVNLLAFEDYQEEKKRLEFLTSQRNDLIESEKTLLQTIEEINTNAERKFLETFEKIRENFKRTFTTLFGPDSEADLRLMPDENGKIDPLESKIEIMAKPRGKRLQSIDLLSAGEKTLTAIALLFAIYLVKPSPFCVLDEVDAPLDDANIERFINMLKSFSDNTQFIIVTHNKKTMESADTLYGVTMEEEGVSKVVSVRFNQTVESRSENI